MTFRVDVKMYLSMLNETSGLYISLQYKRFQFLILIVGVKVIFENLMVTGEILASNCQQYVCAGRWVLKL